MESLWGHQCALSSPLSVPFVLWVGLWVWDLPPPLHPPRLRAEYSVPYPTEWRWRGGLSFTYLWISISKLCWGLETEDKRVPSLPTNIPPRHPVGCHHGAPLARCLGTIFVRWRGLCNHLNNGDAHWGLQLNPEKCKCRARTFLRLVCRIC